MVEYISPNDLWTDIGISFPRPLLLKFEIFIGTCSLIRGNRKEWYRVIEYLRDGNRVDPGCIKQLEETGTLPHMLITDLARYEDEMISESKT